MPKESSPRRKLLKKLKTRVIELKYLSIFLSILYSGTRAGFTGFCSLLLDEARLCYLESDYYIQNSFIFKLVHREIFNLYGYTSLWPTIRFYIIPFLIFFLESMMQLVLLRLIEHHTKYIDVDIVRSEKPNPLYNPVWANIELIAESSISSNFFKFLSLISCPIIYVIVVVMKSGGYPFGSNFERGNHPFDSYYANSGQQIVYLIGDAPILLAYNLLFHCLYMRYQMYRIGKKNSVKLADTVEKSIIRRRHILNVENWCEFAIAIIYIIIVILRCFFSAVSLEVLFSMVYLAYFANFLLSKIVEWRFSEAELKRGSLRRVEEDYSIQKSGKDNEL